MKAHIWSAIFFVDAGIFFIFGIPFYRQLEFGTSNPSKNFTISFHRTRSSAGASYQIVIPKVFGPPCQAKVLEIPSKTTSSTTVTDLLNIWVTNNSTSAKKYKQWNYSGGTYSFKSK